MLRFDFRRSALLFAAGLVQISAGCRDGHFEKTALVTDLRPSPVATAPATIAIDSRQINLTPLSLLSSERSSTSQGTEIWKGEVQFRLSYLTDAAAPAAGERLSFQIFRTGVLLDTGEIETDALGRVSLAFTANRPLDEEDFVARFRVEMKRTASSTKSAVNTSSEFSLQIGESSVKILEISSTGKDPAPAELFRPARLELQTRQFSLDWSQAEWTISPQLQLFSNLSGVWTLKALLQRASSGPSNSLQRQRLRGKVFALRKRFAWSSQRGKFLQDPEYDVLWEQKIDLTISASGDIQIPLPLTSWPMPPSINSVFFMVGVELPDLPRVSPVYLAYNVQTHQEHLWNRELAERMLHRTLYDEIPKKRAVVREMPAARDLAVQRLSERHSQLFVLKNEDDLWAKNIWESGGPEYWKEILKLVQKKAPPSTTPETQRLTQVHEAFSVRKVLSTTLIDYRHSEGPWLDDRYTFSMRVLALRCVLFSAAGGLDALAVGLCPSDALEKEIEVRESYHYRWDPRVLLFKNMPPPEDFFFRDSSEGALTLAEMRRKNFLDPELLDGGPKNEQGLIIRKIYSEDMPRTPISIVR